MSERHGHFAKECEHGRRSDWWCEECHVEVDSAHYSEVKKERNEAIALLKLVQEHLALENHLELKDGLYAFLERVK